MATARRGPRAIEVDLRGVRTTVYANARVADALRELTDDMTLYHGVRMAQVMEAVYNQGLRDGRRQVFDEVEKVKRLPALKHRNPGRPRVSKAKKSRKAVRGRRRRS
jgi:hypothetical protein